MCDDSSLPISEIRNGKWEIRCSKKNINRRYCDATVINQKFHYYWVEKEQADRVCDFINTKDATAAAADTNNNHIGAYCKIIIKEGRSVVQCRIEQVGVHILSWDELFVVDLSEINFKPQNVFGDLTHQRFTNDRHLPKIKIIQIVECSLPTRLVRYYDLEMAGRVLVPPHSANQSSNIDFFIVAVARLFFQTVDETNSIIHNYYYHSEAKVQAMACIFHFAILYAFRNFFAYAGNMLNYKSLSKTRFNKFDGADYNTNEVDRIRGYDILFDLNDMCNECTFFDSSIFLTERKFFYSHVTVNMCAGRLSKGDNHKPLDSESVYYDEIETKIMFKCFDFAMTLENSASISGTSRYTTFMLSRPEHYRYVSCSNFVKPMVRQSLYDYSHIPTDDISQITVEEAVQRGNIDISHIESIKSLKLDALYTLYIFTYVAECVAIKFDSDRWFIENIARTKPKDDTVQTPLWQGQTLIVYKEER